MMRNQIAPLATGIDSARLLFFFGLVLSNISAAQAGFKNETWYKRYPAYPPYCSTPEEMSSRKIPPLRPQDMARVGETRIAHVTSVIRHGARTSWEWNDDCWQGYKDDPEQSTWDCDLTTLLAPPSPREIEVQRGGAPHNGLSDASLQFRKQYDALSHPHYNLRNKLVGTCLHGQLLLQGYDQEFTNGEHLRRAYAYDDGSETDPGIHMRLFDMNNPNARPYEEPLLRYRSHDDQRTLLSGQILLRGLFSTEFVKHLHDEGTHPIIPVHTADRQRDVLTPSHKVCPLLKKLEKIAFESPEYQAFETSQETLSLEHFMKQELGGVMSNTMECLMTTMCTDRKLPDSLKDYGGHTQPSVDALYGSNLFERLYNHSIIEQAFPFKYNDAAYAKLAMGPMWAEIMENISPILDTSSSSSSDSEAPHTKFALFSGHDTTIMPLLASLGPDVWDGTTWPPYASMMIIEIHEILNHTATGRSLFKSDHAFRLLHDGEVLTHRMDGCPNDMDLCDASVLMEQVSSFATRDWDCGWKKSKKKEALPSVHDLNNECMKVLQFILWASLASATLSCVFVYMHFTGKCFPSLCKNLRRRRRRDGGHTV